MKKNYTLLVAFFATAFSICATAQTTTLMFKTYTPVNSGLSSPAINSIALDPQGILWLGTDTGVSRFDHSTFTKYTTKNSGLANNTVNYIAIDSLGNKWIGTDYGMSIFDGNNWRSVPTFAGFPINCISVDSKDTVWVGTDSGLFKLVDTVLIQKYTTSTCGIADNVINDIEFDKLGNVWIATDAGGVSKFDRTAFTNYDTSNSGLKWNTINAIAFDAKGNKWIGSDARGAFYFNDTTWVNYAPTAPAPYNGVTDTTVHTLAIDTAGNVWFGCDVKGLKMLNNTTQKFKTYSTSTTAKALPANKIGALLIDANDTIWIGPGAKGFTKAYWVTTTPITLGSFNGLIEVNKNRLNWTTLTEQNSKGFEVERSINGADFVSIGFVASTKISSGARYEFTDNTPANAKNYYRLKLVDNDGAYYYSKIVLLDNASKDELTIYPNPAKNFISIATSTSKGNVYITDVAGRILKTVTLTSNLNTVDVNNLPSGIYFCKGANKTVSFIKK